MTDSAPWRRGLVCNDSSKRQIRPDSWQRFPRIPRGQARERVLFDLVQQFSKMDLEDLEWLRNRSSAVECHALENVDMRDWNHAAAEQARLFSVTPEIADFAAAQMKGSIDSAALTTRQLLEEVQASLHEAIPAMGGNESVAVAPKRCNNEWCSDSHPETHAIRHRCFQGWQRHRGNHSQREQSEPNQQSIRPRTAAKIWGDV